MNMKSVSFNEMYVSFHSDARWSKRDTWSFEIAKDVAAAVETSWKTRARRQLDNQAERVWPVQASFPFQSYELAASSTSSRTANSGSSCSSCVPVDVYWNEAPDEPGTDWNADFSWNIACFRIAHWIYTVSKAQMAVTDSSSKSSA